MGKNDAWIESEEALRAHIPRSAGPTTLKIRPALLDRALRRDAKTNLY